MKKKTYYEVRWGEMGYSYLFNYTQKTNKNVQKLKKI